MPLPWRVGSRAGEVMAEVRTLDGVPSRNGWAEFSAVCDAVAAGRISAVRPHRRRDSTQSGA
jgi:hypothetical protein